MSERIINGKVCKSSEDKRKAVEDFGGNFNENIEGDYIEGKTSKSKSETSGKNYVEWLNGKRVDKFM